MLRVLGAPLREEENLQMPAFFGGAHLLIFYIFIYLFGLIVSQK